MFNRASLEHPALTNSLVSAARAHLFTLPFAVAAAAVAGVIALCRRGRWFLASCLAVGGLVLLGFGIAVLAGGMHYRSVEWVSLLLTLQAVSIEKAIMGIILFFIVVVAGFNIIAIYTLMVRAKT
ncbi:MAG: hypothetical protein ACYTAF_14425, partial [Planctomycetota bacterium]